MEAAVFITSFYLQTKQLYRKYWQQRYCNEWQYSCKHEYFCCVKWSFVISFCKHNSRCSGRAGHSYEYGKWYIKIKALEVENIKNKHHGAHALRHSLATLLLEEQVKLPVISEVLGHENTESTSYYLRIDIQSLKKYSLDISPVCENFYTQKGGYFYE